MLKAFYPGDKIKLKNSLLLDNPIKKKWYEDQPPDKTYTLVWDKNYKGSSLIFSLKEDKSKPKWLFMSSDFILIKRPWYNKIREYIFIR